MAALKTSKPNFTPPYPMQCMPRSRILCGAGDPRRRAPKTKQYRIDGEIAATPETPLVPCAHAPTPGFPFSPLTTLCRRRPTVCFPWADPKADEAALAGLLVGTAASACAPKKPESFGAHHCTLGAAGLVTVVATRPPPSSLSPRPITRGRPVFASAAAALPPPPGLRCYRWPGS